MMTLRPRLFGLTLGAMILLTAAHVWAAPKDVDGSRMQARSIALGSTQTDALDPPRDAEDWRSVRVKAGQQLVVTLTKRAGSGALALEVFDARGNSIGKGSSSVSVEVKPGIYCIRVSATGPAEYTVSVK